MPREGSLVLWLPVKDYGTTGNDKIDGGQQGQGRQAPLCEALLRRVHSGFEPSEGEYRRRKVACEAERMRRHRAIASQK